MKECPPSSFIEHVSCLRRCPRQFYLPHHICCRFHRFKAAFPHRGVVSTVCRPGTYARGSAGATLRPGERLHARRVVQAASTALVTVVCRAEA
jgi:hypothetical protein